jgi:hypothetical protein
MDGWQRDPAIPTFAARLRWIVAADYADEGLSASLPLDALATVLEIAAGVVASPTRARVRRLGNALAALDEYR